MRFPRLIRPAVAVAALLTLGAANENAVGPPLPANGELGFILTDFAPAIYQDKDDCPQGLAGSVRENFLQTLAAPERERLSRPENQGALVKGSEVWSFGPNNTNICADPEKFPDRATQHVFQGKVATGLDLDGGQKSCGNGEFVSPAGEPGIDNQAYRAMGCTRTYRGVDGVAGDIVRGAKQALVSGEHSMVMLVRGIDSFERDESVEIVFASTDDLPVVDSRQNFVPDVSYTVGRNPVWRNVLRGRIDKGVLTSAPADMRLRRIFGHGGLRGQRGEYDLRSGRLRLTFAPDGSVKGLLGAYQTPVNVILSTVTGGFGAAVGGGYDCAAQYNTLKKLADGGRDPATGQCTTVSAAFDVAAVPAFVFDRAATARTTVGGKQ